MNANKSNSRSNEKSGLTGPILKRLLQIGISILVQAAILFISSGRLDWVMAWAYIGVNVGIVAINALIILPKNPELIAERGQLKWAYNWDRVLSILVSLFWVGTLIVAGLDVRFMWSAQPAWAIQFTALIFVALGYGLLSWAMASNKFFSGVVRIQEDRGHAVSTGGPYQYVRHPGYVGMLISSLATPLLLGSLWALIPGGLVASLYVLRTVLEDRTLQDKLDGYQDYARQVRYRLLPGVW